MNMKRTLITPAVAAAVATALMWPAPASLAAAERGNTETAAPAKTGVPRLADGHPDLSGVWWRGGDIGGRGLNLGAPAGARGGRGGTPPPSYTSLYQPSAQEKAKTL